jgi:predicted ArsR family transcriptional regulator
VAGGSDLGNIIVVKNALATEELRTREVVARAILEGGPATAADLAVRLKITAAGVRRHLDSLVEEGVLEAREPHIRSVASRGRGRPAKVFVMTDGGREQFEHSYDDLAVMAIRFMSNSFGDEAISNFAKYRADDLQRRSNEKTVKEGKDGYAASVHRQKLGHELCQHHCPIAHVAAEYPQICDAETEAFAKVLGTHVQRLATIAHGDGVCTTFVPDLDLVKRSNEKKAGKFTKKIAQKINKKSTR